MYRTWMGHKWHMNMFVDSLRVCVLWVLFLFCRWWWFVFVCRRFPDDDMARSDSRISEESQRIQAKCLMETHVKVFLVLFYSWMSVDWISRIWGSCQCCWNCPLDGSKYVGVSGMDFPDVVNVFVTKMVVSCFDSFCLFVRHATDQLLCWPEFILVMFLWIGGFYLKRGQGLFYFLEICPELSAPRT